MQNVSADIADNCGSAVAVVACAVGHNTVVCGAVVVRAFVPVPVCGGAPIVAEAVGKL